MKRKRICARTLWGMFDFPPSWRQLASETASSIAWVAPFPLAGKKECAASPICMTRAFGDVQLGWGLRQRSSKLTIVFGGVHLTKAWKAEDHLWVSVPGIESMPRRTSSLSTVSVQFSVSVPVT